MRRTFVALGVACTACGLFPDLSSLGSDASMDATAADAPSSDVGIDVGSDAIVLDASDAGAIDASWAYVGSVGALNNAADASAVKVTANGIQKGDLLIVACDSEAKAGAITLDSTTAALVPHEIGPTANVSNSLETVIFWGIVGAPPSGGLLTATATAQSVIGFIDCSIDVYRGGTPSASLIAQKETEGSGSGNVICGAVSTVHGGVAYYIAVRYTCAGTPSAPFVQRQDLEGNPTGDFVPADGTAVSTTLAACNNSTGDWVCLMASISP